MAPASSLSASSLGRKQGPVTTSNSADSMSCPTRTTGSPFALLGTPQGHPRLCLLSLSAAFPGLTPRSPSSRASGRPHAFARALMLALPLEGTDPGTPCLWAQTGRRAAVPAQEGTLSRRGLWRTKVAAALSHPALNGALSGAAMEALPAPALESLSPGTPTWMRLIPGDSWSGPRLPAHPGPSPRLRQGPGLPQGLLHWAPLAPSPCPHRDPVGEAAPPALHWATRPSPASVRAPLCPCTPSPWPWSRLGALRAPPTPKGRHPGRLLGVQEGTPRGQGAGAAAGVMRLA